MGLDHHIKKKLAEFDKNKDDFIGLELAYFRKFFPLHNWVCENIEPLSHNWLDRIYEITVSDLIKFKKFYQNEENAWWKDFDFSESEKTLDRFIDSYKKSKEIFYYDWIN